MIFRYNKQVNKKYWESLIKHKEMFGIKFPKKISITKKDEIYAERKVQDFYVLWDKDKELREVIFKIYKYKLPKRLICYITTAETSAIDLKKKFILLSIYRNSAYIPATIIHEFCHIAFLNKYSNFCKRLGYTNKGIQELKEILTVINNIEFKNIGDKGYLIHQNIRNKIKNLWLESKNNLVEIISNPTIIKFANSVNTIKEN